MRRSIADKETFIARVRETFNYDSTTGNLTRKSKIAKTKRIRNRHINADDKRRGFRGSRKFNGEIRWNK